MTKFLEDIIKEYMGGEKDCRRELEQIASVDLYKTLLTCYLCMYEKLDGPKDEDVDSDCISDQLDNLIFEDEENEGG